MFFFYYDFPPWYLCCVFFSLFQSNKNSLLYRNHGTVGGFCYSPQNGTQSPWKRKIVQKNICTRKERGYAFSVQGFEELFKYTGGLRDFARTRFISSYKTKIPIQRAQHRAVVATGHCKCTIKYICAGAKEGGRMRGAPFHWIQSLQDVKRVLPLHWGFILHQ